MELVKFDAMRAAVSACLAVDEVQEIRNRAVALEAYFRVARDRGPERQASEIRVRAERRAGQLLKDTEKAKGGGDRKSEQYHQSPAATCDPGPPPLSELGITRDQSSTWQRLAEVPEADFEAALADEDVKPSASGIVHNHRAQGTGENEWYTPAPYCAAARRCMGGIDLDPASAPLAQETVCAGEFFTAEDDGLVRPWHGRVWLNPPYSRPLIGAFNDKLVEEYSSGRVEAAVMLTHAYSDTAWFYAAARCCSALCLTRGRISFYGPDGRLASPTQGQAFFYFGKDGPEFCDVFGEFGVVLV